MTAPDAALPGASGEGRACGHVFPDGTRCTLTDHSAPGLIEVHGAPVPATQSDLAARDRRELWRLENFLAVNATTDNQRNRQRLLRKYLNETCPHEYADVSGWGGCPKGTRQCSWCHDVQMPNERSKS